MLPLPKIVLSASSRATRARSSPTWGHERDVPDGRNQPRGDPPGQCRRHQIDCYIGSWITYWTNWGVPRKTVQLVWPEDCKSDLAQISVLTPLGAALIGLHVGDQMPYFVAGRMNLVRVESVKGADCNIVPLVRASAFTDDDPIDGGPGPTAA